MEKTFVKNIKIEDILLFLLGLSLPFKDQFSTVIIISSLFWAICQFGIHKIKINSKKLIPFYTIILLLVLPRVIGLFYGDDKQAFIELIRVLPIILVPFFVLIFGFYRDTIKLEHSFYIGLVIALIFVFLICEFRVIYGIISENQPISYLMRWRYLNFNFTKPIDIHPAYLGILMVWALAYIMFKSDFSLKLKILLLLFLSLMLFQSLARNALIVSFIILFYSSFNQGLFKLKYLLITVIILIFSVSVLHPSDYLRNKFLFIFVDDNPIKDNRFNRFEASYNVFKIAPFFGVGPGFDDELRIKEYKLLNEKVAAEKRYNSHNQFIEFLSTYGSFGLFCFLVSIVLIFYQTKYLIFYRILILAFIFACLTESVLERTLGIKCFSILVAFIFIKQICFKDNKQNLST